MTHYTPSAHTGQWLFTFLLCMSGFIAQANESPKVETDSCDFVKASLIVSTPTDIIYSSLGHCALRMECPSEQLDYCFSLETNTQPGDYVKFFSGDADAAVRAIPTAIFMDAFQKEGRGIMQYELNLTLHEKQLLWKNLDEEMVRPPHLKFNFLNTNCVMMVIVMIKNALINEHLNYGHLPTYATGRNGDGMRYLTQTTPWYQFIYITLAGSICDDHYELEYRMTPMAVVDIFNNSEIVSADNTRRSLFKNQPTELVHQTYYPSSSPITPRVFFSILLAIVIFITLGEWLWGWQKAARITDIVLLTTQFLVGLFLSYTSMVSNLFPAKWNWYLIPCNPVPLILLLCLGKKRAFGIIYLVYTVILVIFILSTPLSSQLDTDHLLFVAILAIRTLSKYMSYLMKKRKSQ